MTREEYDAAVKARPGWTDALNNLGVAQHGLGDNRTAEKTLREVLRVEPRNARGLNNLGVVMAALGRRAPGLCFVAGGGRGVDG